MFTAGKSVSDFLPLTIVWPNQQVQQLGIEMSKTASLASDGASVMMGETGGLAAKLRDTVFATGLQLACTHSVGDIVQVEEWKQTCNNYGSILTTPQSISLCTLSFKKSRSKFI